MSNDTEPNPTWSFYDEYVAFPRSSDNRDDPRTVAQLQCQRRTGEHTEPFTLTWTRLGRSDESIVAVSAYSDGAAALAASGICELLSELGATTPHHVKVSAVTDALTSLGWENRTNALRAGVSHCGTCGAGGYEGPTDILSWRHRNS